MCSDVHMPIRGSRGDSIDCDVLGGCGVIRGEPSPLDSGPADEPELSFGLDHKGSSPPPRPMVPITLPCLVTLLAVEQLVLTGTLPPVTGFVPLLVGAPLALLGTLGMLASRRCGAKNAVRTGAGWPQAGRAQAGWPQAGRPQTGIRRSSRVMAGGPAPQLGVVVACFVLGWVAASGLLRSGESFAASLESSSALAWEFHVTSDPSVTKAGYRCRAHASIAREANCEADWGESASGLPGASGDVWLQTSEPLELGDTLRCVGRFRPVARDDFGISSMRQGVWGTLSVRHVQNVWHCTGLPGIVRKVRERVSDSFDPYASAERAVLTGSVTGERLALQEQGIDELFRRCGVSHLVAVSGSHLAVVAGIAEAISLRLGLGPRVRCLVVLLSSGAFVLFCGAPVSALRAWAMVASSLGAFVVGRRSHALSSVCLVALVMAALDPTLSGQLGYLLSVSAVAGLCLFSRYAAYALDELVPTPRLPRPFRKRLQRPFGHAWRCGLDALGATLVAQAATGPITAATFGEVSLVSPLANVLLGPLFSGVVAEGVVAASLAGVPLAQALPLRLTDLTCGAVLTVLRTLSALPWAYVSSGQLALAQAITGVSILCAVAVWWPRVRARRVWGFAACVGFALCALLVRWRWLAPARICVLDVGQGDAILVQDGGSAVLVDAGNPGALSEPLLRAHVLHLDALVITHLHADHYGGAQDLADAMGCDQVFVGDGVSEHEPDQLQEAAQKLGGVQELSYHDVLRVGGFELRVVSPTCPTDGLQNEDSLVMSVTYDGTAGKLDALLTGDAEKDQLAEALQRNDVGDVDFLKVGHHGSEISLTSDEARALDPEVSVASAGEGNSYGHPRSECVSVLKEADSRFLCTKDVGTVEVRPGKDGPSVKTSKPMDETARDGTQL